MSLTLGIPPFPIPAPYPRQALLKISRGLGRSTALPATNLDAWGPWGQRRGSQGWEVGRVPMTHPVCDGKTGWSVQRQSSAEHCTDIQSLFQLTSQWCRFIAPVRQGWGPAFLFLVQCCLSMWTRRGREPDLEPDLETLPWKIPILSLFLCLFFLLSLSLLLMTELAWHI